MNCKFNWDEERWWENDVLWYVSFLCAHYLKYLTNNPTQPTQCLSICWSLVSVLDVLLQRKILAGFSENKSCWRSRERSIYLSLWRSCASDWGKNLFGGKKRRKFTSVSIAPLHASMDLHKHAYEQLHIQHCITSTCMYIIQTRCTSRNRCVYVNSLMKHWFLGGH